MTPDELFEWAIEHPHYDRWRRFYHDAWVHACDIAAGTPYEPQRVARAIAALSPNKGWTQNLSLARTAVALAAASPAPKDYGSVRAHIEPMGAMGPRKDATAAALADNVTPNGPKVSAFALNIVGELHHVTVDRHMLDMFDGNRDDCIRWCQERAKTSGLWPAEVQAVMWGAWRNTKGYSTY